MPINCPICKFQTDKCACEKPFDLSAIPQAQKDGLARSMFWDIKAFFQVPENQAKFEKWLKERYATI